MPEVASFTSVINSYLPEPHASLLNGILFGVNLKVSGEFNTALRAAGLVHIVVLSGMNITILSAIISALTASLGKKISLMLTILVIVIFVAFVGVKAPIMRAAFMGILTIVAILYGKRNIPLFALCLSAFGILCFRPDWLSSLSFQLSYAATLGIILFGPVAGNPPQTTSGRAGYAIWKEMKPSLAAQIFTSPLIAFHFRELSLIAPLSNLFAAPIIAPLMIFGFLTVFLGKLHPLLGLLPSYVCFALLSLLVFIIEQSVRIPFAYIRF